MSSNPATPTTEPLLPPNVERSFDTSVPPPPSSSKFLPSYLNLTNSVLGAGVLTLPYAFSLTGIYLGFLLLVLFSLLSALSLHYLDASLTSASTTIPSSKSSSPPPTTYASLAHYFCGSRVSLLTTTSSLLYSYGSSVSYLLITLNLLVDLTSYSRLGWSVAIGLPMLPLTNMRDISGLQYTSLLAMLCVFYLTFVISYRYTQGDQDSSHCDPVAWDLDPSDVLRATPLFCFAFNCQIQYPTIRSSSTSPSSPTKITVPQTLLITLTMLTCAVIYSLSSSLGYLTFCSSTTSNVLDSYPSSDPLIIVARWSFAVVLLCSYPLYSGAIVRDFGEFRYGPEYNDPSSAKAHGKDRMASTFLTVSSMLLIAYADPPLDKVTGLTGAIGGSSLVYVLPGIIGFKGGCWGGRFMAAGGIVVMALSSWAVLNG